MIDLDYIMNFLKNLEHKPSCGQHHDNIYHQGEECNCGLSKSIEELNKVSNLVIGMTTRV